MTLVMMNQLWFVEVQIFIREHEQTVLFRGYVHAFDVKALRAEPWVQVLGPAHRCPIELPVSLFEHKPRKIYDEIGQVDSLLESELRTGLVLQAVVESSRYHRALREAKKAIIRLLLAV